MLMANKNFKLIVETYKSMILFSTGMLMLYFQHLLNYTLIIIIFEFNGRFTVV